MDTIGENRLVWTPIYQHIVRKTQEHTKLVLMISPFIKRTALNQLLDHCENTTDLKIIVRWDKSDIVSQVSDLEIYEDLKERSIPLYRHPKIHLKLLVFNQNWAFSTSGNITQKGLGLTDDSNIEVGVQTRLEVKDWINIQTLLTEATLIDDVIYKRACEYRDSHAEEHDSLPTLDLEYDNDANFSRLSLPAIQSPEQLYEIYKDPNKYQNEGDLYCAFVHDIVLYEIDMGLDHDAFFDQLRMHFKSHPFIKAISSFIEEKRSVGFGEMNNWITTNCSDKPTPYRWELKSSTNRLYDWLAYYFEEISWNRKNYSQIIHWNYEA